MSVMGSSSSFSHDDFYHAFLVPSPEYNHNPVDMMRRLWKGIDSFPVTKATFRRRHIFPEIAQTIPESFWTHAAVLTNTWRIPKVFATNTGNSTRYVNPEYEHRARYSDAVVECDCGSKLLSFDNPMHDGDNHYVLNNTHADSCRKEWKLASRAELWANRRQIITHGLWLWNSLDDLQTRLGDVNASSAARHLDIDVDTIRYKARARCGQTVSLLHENYSYSEIGEIYGKPKSTVHKLATEFGTGETLEEFNQRRHDHYTDYPEPNSVGVNA